MVNLCKMPIGACELGKIALEHLVRIMCMIMLGYSLRIGSRFRPLCYTRVACDHVFVGFCFASSIIVLGGRCDGH